MSRGTIKTDKVVYMPSKDSDQPTCAVLPNISPDARPVKIISLILSRVNREVGRKRGIPEKNHLNIHKQNLACRAGPEHVHVFHIF